MDDEKLADVKLSGDWQIVADVTGDLLQATTKFDCLYQEICLEALTQEGDLWYEHGFGWSLLDFAHSLYDELLEIEIKQRIMEKLSWYQEVDISSIYIEIVYKEDGISILIKFCFFGSDEEYQMNLKLDGIYAEVKYG